MIIEKVRIYGLSETAEASGYPMKISDTTERVVERKGESRLVSLGKARSGSGHDCALKGVVVQADVTAPQYWWLQFGRYHFADIVSSQSKMHRITKMDIDKQCNKYVDRAVKEHLKQLVKAYNASPIAQPAREVMFQRIIANCPMGLMLTARITTNYLQLKTMHNQRRRHRLEEWQIFCDWIEELPLLGGILE